MGAQRTHTSVRVGLIHIIVYRVGLIRMRTILKVGLIHIIVYIE
jgi:hypothetical protein